MYVIVAKKGHNLKYIQVLEFISQLKNKKFKVFETITCDYKYVKFFSSKKFDLIAFNFDCFFVVCFDRMGIINLICGYFRNKH